MWCVETGEPGLESSFPYFLALWFQCLTCSAQILIHESRIKNTTLLQVPANIFPSSDFKKIVKWVKVVYYIEPDFYLPVCYLLILVFSRELCSLVSLSIYPGWRILTPFPAKLQLYSKQFLDFTVILAAFLEYVLISFITIDGIRPVSNN